MPLPKSVLTVMARGDGLWTEHAADGRDRLDLTWADILAVARSAPRYKRTRDSRQPRGGYVFAAVGRDTCGRKLYMAGKLVTYGNTRLFRVLTVHEAN